MSITVAVVGASGYAGGELLRLLSAHPEFEIATAAGLTNAGRSLAEVHPHLRSLATMTVVPMDAAALANHDVVFLAVPHGQSGSIAAALPPTTLVIDCGADHRLTDEADWDTYYGGAYAGSWVYGLPELVVDEGSKQREQLQTAKRIAVPGCNATAVILGVAPGIQAGVIDASDVVCVLTVAASGAGKSARPELMASELIGSANAYGVGGSHRHNPEIRQNLVAAGGRDVRVSFTPVLVPLSRGILAVSTARLSEGADASRFAEPWQQTYRDEPFVHVLPAGHFPRSGDTVGAGTALVGLGFDELSGRVVIVSALDNLGKGTASAAVQCANIALGLPETLGLTVNGVAP